MADGGRSTQDLTLAALLAIDMAEHMARGRDAFRSISPAILTAGVGQNEDMGDGVVSLNAVGATGGCIANRDSNAAGEGVTGEEHLDQAELSTALTEFWCPFQKTGEGASSAGVEAFR